VAANYTHENVHYTYYDFNYDNWKAAIMLITSNEKKEKDLGIYIKVCALITKLMRWVDFSVL